jgi:hypothetical protein
VLIVTAFGPGAGICELQALAPGLNKHLNMLAVEPVVFDDYRYLVNRREKGREQPYLRGRNMTGAN